MHHRIRPALKRRLKHTSVEIEKPVTDIVNEAIEGWLKQVATPHVPQSPHQALDYAALSRLRKSTLIMILVDLGGSGDSRMSSDHIIDLILKKVPDGDVRN